MLTTRIVGRPSNCSSEKDLAALHALLARSLSELSCYKVKKKNNSDRGHLGWEPGRIRGRRGTGDGRENGGGGSSEKVGKGRFRGGGITQEGLIFRNRKSAKGRKARKKLREPVMQGKWSGRFEPMPYPPQREIFAEHC